MGIRIQIFVLRFRNDVTKEVRGYSITSQKCLPPSLMQFSLH